MGRLLRVPGTLEKTAQELYRLITLDVTRVKSKTREEAKELQRVLRTDAHRDQIEAQFKDALGHKLNARMVHMLQSDLLPRTVMRNYQDIRWDGNTINSELPDLTFRNVLVDITPEEREMAGHLNVKGQSVSIDEFDLDGPQVGCLPAYLT